MVETRRLNSQQSEYVLFRVIDCVYEDFSPTKSKNTQNASSMLLESQNSISEAGTMLCYSAVSRGENRAR